MILVHRRIPSSFPEQHPPTYIALALMVLKRPRYLSTRALARFDAHTSDGFESRKTWHSLYAARFEPSWFSIRAPCASAFLLFSVSSGDSNAVICGRDRGWVVISRIITHHAYNEQRDINIHIICFYDRASLYTEYHLLMNFNPSPHVGNNRRAKQAAN